MCTKQKQTNRIRLFFLFFFFFLLHATSIVGKNRVHKLPNHRWGPLKPLAIPNAICICRSRLRFKWCCFLSGQNLLRKILFCFLTCINLPSLIESVHHTPVANGSCHSNCTHCKSGQATNVSRYAAQEWSQRKERRLSDCLCVCLSTGLS